MKKLALTICALSIFALSFGQKTNQVNLDKGKMQFNIGVGLSSWGIPIYAGVDYWIDPDITIGLEASMRFNLWYSYTVIGGSINGNYHFNKLLDLPDNLDVYAGISAGPYFSLGGYWNHLHFGFAGQVGGRYKINDKMWLNLELGGGSFSGGKIGITIRR
jgi:hypothetical protein